MWFVFKFEYFVQPKLSKKCNILCTNFVKLNFSLTYLYSSIIVQIFNYCESQFPFVSLFFSMTNIIGYFSCILPIWFFENWFLKNQIILLPILLKFYDISVGHEITQFLSFFFKSSLKFRSNSCGILTSGRKSTTFE